MTLEQSLRDLMVKHDLMSISLEVTNYLEKPRAVVFWSDKNAEHNCQIMRGEAETFTESLTLAITNANVRRAISADVVLPDAPLSVEVSA